VIVVLRRKKKKRKEGGVEIKIQAGDWRVSLGREWFFEKKR